MSVEAAGFVRVDCLSETDPAVWLASVVGDLVDFKKPLRQ